MNPLQLLAISIICYLASALISVVIGSRNERSGTTIAGVLGAIGGLFGLISAGLALISGQTWNNELFSPFSFAKLTISMDPLGAYMLLVISAVMLAASVFSIQYMKEYYGKGAWGICAFVPLFVASMAALVVADNAFYFIVFFEMMSLASYFLVLVEQSEKSVKAGLQYFFIAHAGSVLIMIAFFMLYRASGSMSFHDFAQLDLPVWEASVIFLLIFFGFGAKAGMITLHGWLPLAHPAAPSHASALMSGVMVKIGVFGIIKISLMVLHADQAWWGYVVLGFGAVSSVLGVMYALAENDIKRLLAYSTVENVGIILMGVGVAMIGKATGHTVFAALALLGALYHLLNHAVFKALLFLGAGSVIYRVHSKNLDAMGGLGKLMPYTALAFLIGAMAISALPPLNGFVSEWYIYQSLFSMAKTEQLPMLIGAPIAVVMLAITGALACVCFVKLYGVCFCGSPRNDKAAQAKEVGGCMVAGVALLALGCVVLGVGSPWISPYVADIAGAVLNQATIKVAHGIALHPVSVTQAILSTPVITISLLILLLVPAVILAVFQKTRLKFRKQGDPWACGYAYEQRMTVSSEGFSQPVRVMFSPAYQLRQWLAPGGWMKRTLTGATRAAGAVEPIFDNWLVQPCSRAVVSISQYLSRMQGGDFRVYCLYIIIALVVLLAIPFEMGVN